MSRATRLKATGPFRDGFELPDHQGDKDGLRGRTADTIQVTGRRAVSVRCACSDDWGLQSIMSMIDNGHLEALDGGQEGAEEAVLV